MEKKSQGLTWTLTTPAKPGVAQVILRLRDEGGKPVQGRIVTGEVWMPGMPMDGYPLELRFEEARDGQYLALVQYGHGGRWQIRAAFRTDEGRDLRQAFDFDIGH
ncbi:MAG: FixH family protein [Desulfovibrio sp.]|nr:FixH family protein [Desulfovibrio sp.]